MKDKDILARLAGLTITDGSIGRELEEFAEWLAASPEEEIAQFVNDVATLETFRNPEGPLELLQDRAIAFYAVMMWRSRRREYRN